MYHCIAKSRERNNNIVINSFVGGRLFLSSHSVLVSKPELWYVLGPSQSTRFFTRFFPQHLISKLSVVNQVWPNDSIFHSNFVSTFQQSQIFARPTRRYCACFHLTSSTRWPNESISLNNNSYAQFFWQRSNFSQHHSTPLDSLKEVAKRLDLSLDFCRVKIRVKNRVVWSGPKEPKLPN